MESSNLAARKRQHDINVFQTTEFGAVRSPNFVQYVLNILVDITGPSFGRPNLTTKIYQITVNHNVDQDLVDQNCNDQIFPEAAPPGSIPGPPAILEHRVGGFVTARGCSR